MIALIVAVSAATCTPSVVQGGQQGTVAIISNCPAPAPLLEILRDAHRTTTIHKIEPDLPLAVAPPPQKVEADPPKAKPKPKAKAKKKAKAKPKVRTRCGSKRAVWYTNSKGQRRYRCR